MQLEETIAKELAGIIKEQMNTIEQRIVALEGRTFPVPEYETCAPDDVIDTIAKAVALLAEAPPLTKATSNPVVVNFSPPNAAKKIKTITTRRDEAGNLVARVIED